VGASRRNARVSLDDAQTCRGSNTISALYKVYNYIACVHICNCKHRDEDFLLATWLQRRKSESDWNSTSVTSQFRLPLSKRNITRPINCPLPPTSSWMSFLLSLVTRVSRIESTIRSKVLFCLMSSWNDEQSEGDMDSCLRNGKSWSHELQVV
jgi:hypothetical protein